MSFKTLLPWLCVLALLICFGWLYSADQKKDTELAALRQDSQQLDSLRAELEDAKKAHTQADSDELTQLRKDREELLRLRNEVGQLRNEKQQMSAQVQTAQAQAQNAQQQVAAMRVNPQPPPTAAQPNALTAQAAEQAQANLCINNLRMIEAAKQQYALAKGKPRGALVIAADLAPYLKSNTVPACPSGGIYTLNPIGIPPLCSISGHALPK